MPRQHKDLILFTTFLNSVAVVPVVTAALAVVIVAALKAVIIAILIKCFQCARYLPSLSLPHQYRNTEKNYYPPHFPGNQASPNLRIFSKFTQLRMPGLGLNPDLPTRDG